MLVKMACAGFCHTETIVLDGDYGGRLPMIPGHENVGTVALVGSGVKGFEVGDRIGVGLFQNSCGKCNECLGGNSNFCSKVRLAGLNSDGGMAQYTIADPSSTFKLPDSLSFADAVPMMCAGSTVFNSIRRADQPPGSIIAIVGLGSLGHLGRCAICQSDGLQMCRYRQSTRAHRTRGIISAKAQTRSRLRCQEWS